MNYRQLGCIVAAAMGLACGPSVLFAGNATVYGWPCASSVPNWGYAFLLDAPGGRDMLATVLAAKAAGQMLQVVGNGTCTIDPTLEGVSYVVTW
jgi:hypothetical protein